MTISHDRSENGLSSENTAAPPPIWVHSSFRVSSTWIWWRFRQNPDVVAYYEIFNEALAELEPSRLAIHGARDWNSSHPPVAPYLLEYIRAHLEGEMRLYDPRMAYERFMPTAPDKSISDEEAAYLAGLIRCAAAEGRRPVLTAVRSLGRVQGLRQRFGGYHILWYRNIFRQWCSFSGQYHSGNSYFLDRINDIIARSKHDRFFSHIDESFPQNDSGPEDWPTFQRFMLFHLYLYLLAFPHCDLTISSDRVAADESYRQTIAAQIEAATQVRVDLSGATANIELTRLPLDTWRTELETTRIMAKMMPTFLSSWSEEQEQFMRSLVDEVEGEIERYAFYSAAIHRYAKSSAHSLKSAREALDEKAAAWLQREQSYQAQIEQLRHAQVQAEGATHSALELLRQSQSKARQAHDENARLAEQREQIAAQREQAHHDLAAAERTLAETQAQLSAAWREKDRALAAIYGSTSWRVTSILRWIKKLVRRTADPRL